MMLVLLKKNLHAQVFVLVSVGFFKHVIPCAKKGCLYNAKNLNAHLREGSISIVDVMPTIARFPELWIGTFS
jgi:hypothetical protein